MDPVSVLSLVANIFGVISFATGVVKIATQIHQSGANDQIDNLERSSDALERATSLIRSQQNGRSGEEDQGIIKLAETCVNISNTISKLLDDVRGSTGKHAAWRTFRQIFKTVWNLNTINELNTQIAEARATLQLRAVILIKIKLDRQSVQFEDALRSLDERSASLLSASTFFDSFNELGGQVSSILATQYRGETLAQARHREIIGGLDAISRGVPQVTQPSPLNTQPEVNEDQLFQVKRAILLSLWFPAMTDRQEGIRTAFKETYEWVFRDSRSSQKPWDDLRTFLLQDQRTYWITGKPGSGKSTLMKYIIGHTQTEECLKKWAGGKDLVIAQYYFFHRGSDMQKSELGVLRSLLHQILQARRDLIELAFPERYQVLCMGGRGTPFEPQVLELKNSLNRILRTCSSTYFFLAVDGLDEYAASATEMALLVRVFKDVAALPNVKTLLSSRPWAIFEESFRGCPRLRLHELTRPDIMLVVDQEIGKHPRSQALQAKHPSAIDQLKKEIVQASSGVFLWVILVIRSLLEGLKNHDTVDHLRARLLEFPNELEQLFYHIWEGIPPLYRTEASRLLLLIEAGTSGSYKLSLLGLSFAMETKADVLAFPVKSLFNEVDDRLETIKVHLLTRCMGLGEIHESNKEPKRTAPGPNSLVESTPISHDMYVNVYESEHSYPHVGFLHKTVYEFLSSPDVRQELAVTATSPGSREPFYAVVALLHSALMRIKTWTDVFECAPRFGPYPGRPRFPVDLDTLVQRCLSLAREAEAATGKPQIEVLNELDRVMGQHRANLLEPDDSLHHWAGALHQHDRHRVNHLHKGAPIGSLLSLAVSQGMTLYVRHVVSEDPYLLHADHRRPLLYDALFPFGARFGEDESAGDDDLDPDMIEFLLNHGGDLTVQIPNGWNDSASLWWLFLHRLNIAQPRSGIPETLGILLRHGVDVRTTVEGFNLYQICRKRRTASPYEIRNASRRQAYADGMDEVMRTVEALGGWEGAIKVAKGTEQSKAKIRAEKVKRWLGRQRG